MAENFGTAFDTTTSNDELLHVPKEGMQEAKKTPRELAQEVEEYFKFYSDQLQEPYRRMVRFWKLFMNEIKDKRLPHEKWRAFVPVPYPWSIVKTLSSSFNELILGQSPTIKAEGVGIEDDASADKISRLFDYIFRKINFDSELKRYVEEMFIQGVAVRKNSLVVKEKNVIIHPTASQGEEFEVAISDAQSQNPELGEAPLNDPEGFEVWRQQAREIGVPVPAMPIPGPTTVRRYRGPGFLRTSIFDMLFNPNVADFSDQPCIIQRAIKPLSWLKDRTGPGKDKIFDPALVGEAIGRAGDNQVNEWQNEISSMYGINPPDQRDPQLKNAVEIWEAWMPGNVDATYRVVLNREIVINKNTEIPYFHGSHPYIFSRNHTVAGQAIGVSEFKPVERMFYEMNTFRGLRLDALLMSILPVFVKAKEAGLTELQKHLIAGLIIETHRPEVVSQLTKIDIDPSIFREGAELKNDIDEALGTLPNLRGKETAPRIPATSTERAFSSTFARVKDRVVEFEGEISEFCPNSLFMLYQFWPSSHTVRVGGDPPMAPFIEYKREDFLEALDADYAFRGARTALNEDSQIQNMKDLFTIVVNAQLPHFKANIFVEDMMDKIMKAGSARRYMMSDEDLAQQQAENPPVDGEGAGPEDAQAQGPPGPPA